MLTRRHAGILYLSQSWSEGVPVYFLSQRFAIFLYGASDCFGQDFRHREVFSGLSANTNCSLLLTVGWFNFGFSSSCWFPVAAEHT